MARSALPNFFFVGAPKSGSTSLYFALDQHPEIYLSPIKEPCFFASEIQPNQFSEEFLSRVESDLSSLRTYLDGPMTEKRFSGLVLQEADYLQLFKNVRNEKAIGEASVCYLWSPTAAQNIRRRIPEAKIIMILRNPADRAFSQYLHAVSNQLLNITFGEAIEVGLHQRHSKFGPLYPFLEFGLYHDQLKRYLETFPRECIKVFLYENYASRPLLIFKEICQFLGVDPSFTPNFSHRYLQPQIPRFPKFQTRLRNSDFLRRLIPPSVRAPIRSFFLTKRNRMTMQASDRQRLVSYYSSDVKKLMSLLGMDLTAWLR